MTESAPQEQQNNTQESTRPAQQTENRQERSEDRNTEGMVPSARLREETRKRQDLERQLAEREQADQQREEQAAQKQGEWEKVAEKRQGKIDTLYQRVKELENQIVRDKRFRAWTQGASGVIRSDALGDAFEYVTEDEWSTVNEDDENSVRMLAQGLAERKTFLAGGPIGAGSGGSSRPVLALTSNRETDDKRTQTFSSGRQTMRFNSKKRHW